MNCLKNSFLAFALMTVVTVIMPMERIGIPVWRQEESPFWCAVESGDVVTVRRWINDGKEIKICAGIHDSTPLHYAAECGHGDIVKLPIDAGFHVDSPDSNGSTPLMSAIVNGHADVANLLIALGANIHLQNKGYWFYKAVVGCHY